MSKLQTSIVPFSGRGRKNDDAFSYYSMVYTIAVNGVYLNNERRSCIESLNTENPSDAPDTCQIVIVDPDFLFIEDNIFIEDASVYVSMSWYGDPSNTTFEFTGNISTVDMNFPETGYPTLTITAMDGTSHRMNRSKKKRSWENVTRAYVIQQIAREYGLSPEIESGYSFKTEETITQSDETDLDFIMNLAEQERDPFLCKVAGTRLLYKKMGFIQSPSATLTYKDKPYDIISFSPQITKETKSTEVEYADINTASKTTDVGIADDSTVRDVSGESAQVGGGSSSSSASGGSSKVYDPVTKTWKTVDSSTVNRNISGSDRR